MKHQGKNAFGLLQLGAIMQAAGDDELVAKMGAKARQFVAATALASVALGVAGAAAAQDQGPINPSNCARLGTGVGAALGSMAGKTWETRAIAAALGAFGGSVAGHYACAERESARMEPQGLPQANHPETRHPQANTPHSARLPYPPVQAPNYLTEPSRTTPVSLNESLPRQAQQMTVATAVAPAHLSVEVRNRLDEMASSLYRTKESWKTSLADLQIHQTGSHAEVERLRKEFELERAGFAKTVHLLAVGGQGVPPQNVSRYLEISAAFSELPTKHPVSIRALQYADEQQAATRVAYRDESRRAAAPR